MKETGYKLMEHFRIDSSLVIQTIEEKKTHREQKSSEQNASCRVYGLYHLVHGEWVTMTEIF